MGIVHDGVVLIGRDEVAHVLDHIHAGGQTGLRLRGVGGGQDADDLAGQLGVGVGRAGVEALGIRHAAVGLLRGLVQGGIGHIITVGRDQGQGLLARQKAQLLGHIRRHVGDDLGRQYACSYGISFHGRISSLLLTVSDPYRWPSSPA